MDSHNLSPELRELLRRLVLARRKRGFVTCEELDRAFGPREMSGSIIEDAMAYLLDEGLEVVSESDIDPSPPPRGGALRLVNSRSSRKPDR